MTPPNTTTARLRALLDELNWKIDQRQPYDFMTVLKSAYALALEDAEKVVTEVEEEQRARVGASDERGPIWKDGKAMSSGIYHVAIYMRQAIRMLAADVGRS